ncbi:hypothetical protein [Haemophilus parainfluenzae]|uniref:hypothetical protein n=1 Tax=Haemophilus parainfluenzae TaxID=729 RepID=UPI003B21D108
MQNSTYILPFMCFGNGQLGRMLRYAGAPLDIHVQPLEFNAPVFDLPKDAIITAEIERWEKTPLTELLGHHKISLIRMFWAYWLILLPKNPY